MLPDFPQPKKHVDQFVRRFFQERVTFHLGFMSQCPRTPIWEGIGWRLVRPDGSVDESDLKRVSGEFELPSDPSEGLTFEMVLERLDKAAQEIAKAQRQHMYKRVGEVAKEVGNEISVKMNEFGARALNDIMDRMQIDFDEEGNPLLPSLVLHPEMGKKLMEQKEAIESDVVERQRREEMLVRKREEFRDRESRRRLVD